MSDIIKQLREYARDDHMRGCEGRNYFCDCGYDAKRDPLLLEAADEIERLWAAFKRSQDAVENCLSMERALDNKIEDLMAEIKQLRDERDARPTDNEVRAALTEAIARLTSDNAKLRAETAELLGLKANPEEGKPWSQFRTEVELRQEVTRLQAADQTVKDLIEHHNKREAEIERLRAALQEISTAHWIDEKGNRIETREASIARRELERGPQ